MTKENLGSILIAAAQKLDSSYESDNKNDMGDALEIVCDKVVQGGSGGDVDIAAIKY